MTLRKFILIFTLILQIPVFAQQQIVGIVKSTKGELIIGASIRVFNADNRMINYAISNKNGEYKITLNDIISGDLEIDCSCLGYKNERLKIDISTLNKNVNFVLQSSDIEIEEVVVKAPAIRNIGDTIQYNINSFISKSDRNIEDVIRRLPGIQVENNGQIYYNGESINKFYIEDMDLLGNRYAIATRNISPEDIATVSIYENHQNKQVLKDVIVSNKAALNIKLKDNRRLHPIGYAQIGAGYGDNFNWIGEIFGMQVSPKNQTIITAKGNNHGDSYNQEVQSLVDRKSYNNVANRIFSQFPFGQASINDNRYFKNNSAMASVNTLFKLNKHSSLSAYIDYTYDKNNFSNSVITDYLTNENNAIRIVESNNSTLNNHISNIQLKYENNDEKLYLLEELKLSGKFYDNLYRLQHDQKIEQTLNTHYFRITNDFATVIRSQNNIYEINSYISYSNTPINYINAIYPDSNTLIVNQNAQGQSFHTQENSSFSWILSRTSLLGADISFEAMYDEFSSYNTLYNDKIEQNNSNNGYKIITSVIPFYQLKNEHITWRTEIPIRMHNIKYNDTFNNIKYTLNKPFIEFSSRLNFYIFKHIKSSFTIGRENIAGDISNIITNPIYTTYRQQYILGAGILGIQSNNYASFNANYRNAISGFFGSLHATYGIINNNTMTAAQISSSNSTFGRIEAGNNGSNANVIINLSLNQRAWNTTFGLSGSALYMRRNTSRQEEVLDIKTQVYTIAADIRSTFWDDRIAMNINCRYGANLQSANKNLQSTFIDELAIQFDISVTPIKNWDIYYKSHFNYPFLHTASSVNNIFIDCGTRYKYNKVTFEIAGTNLTNKKIYTYTLLNAYDQYTYSFALRPIEILFTVRYDF